MKARIGAALAVWLGVAGLAMADDQGQGSVVVELYTSQGCSSCPPADEILAGLADRGDVIALALHVDYWDYIGWKDVFGSPQFTERQRAYARAAGARTIYTPQMIVDGMEHLVGARPAELTALIKRYEAMPEQAVLDVARKGGTLAISARPVGHLPQGAVVQLVRYKPEETVEIRSGENAGREISYRNIVTEWHSLGTWDGSAPLSMDVSVSDSQPIVVILQEPGPGRIIAATALK
ncbi:hypothetical protein LX70_00432 [Defluviimonas denitrificans]|uniref:Secreted protein n=1 Tax=Albidovulum denitrificans TaxID=404881 RepID=A0A2S8SCV3_9RHOB|nr:DUF1223 domain-containing protein [Defluviimonas denitrificans]PQV58620.1 hypothetical protein LX70_00432 [Defluviimonas denitrificans]